MARNRWTGGAALGAMVLGATAITGFTPPADGAARDGAAAARDREVRAAVAAGVFDAGPSDRTGGRGHRVEERAGTAQEDDATGGLGADYVRHRVARILPAALAPICSSAYGQEMTFPLFDDVTVKAVETKRSTFGSLLVWHGTVPGTSDQDVVLTLEGGCDRRPGNEILSAQFMLGGDLYAVEPLAEGRALVTQTSPVTDEDEPVVLTPPATRPVTGVRPAQDSAAAGAVLSSDEVARAAACKGGQGYSLVDVLVGYTPGARTEAGGDAEIRAAAARGIALTNEAFAESGVRTRVRLVGTALASVPASLDGVTDSLLSAVASPTDGIADNLPQLRDQYGADLVSVVAAGRAPGGLGYTPHAPGPSTAAWGYSVVGRSAVPRFSMGHEIGHNLGADHDRVTQPVQPENGAGGYFPRNGAWSSAMAYESSCRTATKGACTRINRFSNPRRSYRGEPLGIPLGKPGSADSTDVLSRSGTAVAAYRAARTSDALCAVTTSVAPQGAGTVTAGTPGPYPQGTSSTYDAVANEGYVFSGWKLDGKPAEGGAAGFRAPAGDHTLVAEFKTGTAPAPTVTTTTSGSGTVRKLPAERAEPGATDPLYAAVPAPGWDFAGWVLDGSHAGDADVIALDAGTDDRRLTALFEQKRHQLTVVEEGGGTVALSQDGPYSDGDTVTATATPSPGHAFTRWLLDGKPYGGDEDRAKGETAILFKEQGHTLTAVFERA